METNYDTDVVDVSQTAFEWFRRQCKLEARGWKDGPIRCPVDLLFLLGEEMGSAFLAGINQVVSRHTAEVFRHMITHLIRPDQAAREGLMVQDVQGEEGKSAVCVLLAVTGVGVVRLAKQSRLGYRNVDRVQVENEQCILYGCSTPYALCSRVIYVHCKFSVMTVPYSPVYNSVYYLCPYNPSVVVGTIRAYPKGHRPHPNPACGFSERKWKRVIDHLAHCKYYLQTRPCESKENKVPEDRNIINIVSDRTQQDQSPPEQVGGGENILELFNKLLVYQTVRTLLSDVSRADVRQPSGRREQNTGELTAVAVSTMLEGFQPILPTDIFIDVGSGVGNVIIQAALESNFLRCVGIEMRSELTAITNSVLDRHVREHRDLRKVKVVTGDITTMDFENVPDVSRATHLFCSNEVFTDDALLALEELCWLPELKIVVMTQVPCPRHTQRCSKWFCQAWRHFSTIRVPVTYRSSGIAMNFFRKQTISE